MTCVAGAAHCLQESKRSTLYRNGTPGGQTAMSVTVGVPAAIATELLLKGAPFRYADRSQFTAPGEFTRKGVLRPVTKDIYTPILDRLESLGIKIVEESH